MLNPGFNFYPRTFNFYLKMYIEPLTILKLLEVRLTATVQSYWKTLLDLTQMAIN